MTERITSAFQSHFGAGTICAALAGALVVVAGYVLNFPPTTMAITGAALCFGIRLVAIRRGWRLLVAGLPQQSKSDGSENN